MNYTNFSCRLVAQRLPAVVQTLEPRKAEPKKKRKPSLRRRLLVTAVVTAIALSVALPAPASAGSLALEQADLHLVAASGTVAFTGNTGHLVLDLPLEAMGEENDFAAQLEAFSEQVSALTAKPFPSVRPTQAVQLSALTGVLLCAGLGVAIVRAGLLFRTDLIC